MYCQGGGYFGGYDDGLGPGRVPRRLHVEGETWDVSHPTEVVDEQGRRFEFDHAWAENFTRLTSDGQTGLAHYECVVIQEAQDWSTAPGRTADSEPMTTPRTHQLVLDRQEIAELCARYTTALDTMDWALLESCFAAEPGLRPPRRPAGGFAEILARTSAALTSLTRTQHLLGNVATDGRQRHGTLQQLLPRPARADRHAGGRAVRHRRPVLRTR